jgi:hypothetical protein
MKDHVFQLLDDYLPNAYQESYFIKDFTVKTMSKSITSSFIPGSIYTVNFGVQEKGAIFKREVYSVMDLLGDVGGLNDELVALV